MLPPVTGLVVRRRNEQTVAYNICIPAGAWHNSNPGRRQHWRIRNSEPRHTFRRSSDKPQRNADDTGADFNAWHHNPDSGYPDDPDSQHYNDDAWR